MLDLSEENIARLLTRNAQQLAERARGKYCKASSLAGYVQLQYDAAACVLDRDRCHSLYTEGCT